LAELKVVELKFWCYLASKSYENALEMVQDALYFMSPSNPWMLAYRALQYGIEMQLNGEVNTYSMECLFGSEVSTQAWLNLRGEQTLWDEATGLDIFKSSARHQALLSIYKETQAVKAQKIKG